MIYYFNGSDSSSDDGYWVMVIEAPSKVSATKLIKFHLEEMNRKDLIEELDPEPVKGPIYYSSVERR